MFLLSCFLHLRNRYSLIVVCQGRTQFAKGHLPVARCHLEGSGMIFDLRCVLCKVWFMLAALLLLVPLPALAQGQAPRVASWSEPVNISQSIGDSSDPTIVADSTGAVHLLWSEKFGEETDGQGQRIHGNTLMYSRWDNGMWSTPIDVLVSPDGGEVWQPVAATDKFGGLHVIWASMPGGKLYYSHAVAEQASSAQGWVAPIQLYSGLPTATLPGGLAVNSQGTVHVIATSRDPGWEVVHMSSSDGGLTWSSTTSLSSAMPFLQEVPLVSAGIAFTIDKMDHLHAGWSMYNGEGFSAAVYYTQSVDGGMSWRTPLIVGQKAETDFDASWLNIATASEGQVFLVWTGIGKPPGRIYRTSSDGGLTWTPATPFMEGLVGGTGSPRMVVDSAEIVHLLTPARAYGTDSGVRYLYWLGQDWTAPAKIPGPPPDPGFYPALQLTATANLGNQIWMAWTDQLKGDIFVTNGESGASATAAISFVAPPQNDDMIEPRQPVGASPPAPTATAALSPEQTRYDTAPPGGVQTMNPMTLLIVSVGPSAGVVIAILLGITAAKRRR